MSDKNTVRPVSRRKFITCAGGATLSLPWMETFADTSKGQKENPAQR